MVDREKVIKGLGCCISGNTAICKRVGCPYAEEHDGIGDTCIDHLMADALALLKAQEPVVHGKWIWMSSTYDRSPCKARYMCSKCRHETITHSIPPWEKYCPNCGAKMDGDA